MQIWLDLRFLRNDYYSKFVLDLVKWLIETNKENKYIIYTNSLLEWFDFDNLTINNVWIRNNTLKEQTNFLKILNNDKNNIVIFFNHYKPIFYKKTYYTLIPSLKKISYNDFKGYFEKYSYLFMLENSIKSANKVICFDDNSKNELIERFNIDEEKINLLQWFFPNKKDTNKNNEINIDIRNKYDIKNNYFIYHFWDWIEKNYEKLIKVFSRLKDNNIDLIFLWNNISKNIYLRDLIKKANLENNIKFFPVLKSAEIELFYKNSLWVIIPTFYEPFPFRLNNAIYYNSNIISSDLKSIKNIFWDKIKYFSPIYTNSIYNIILDTIENKKIKIDYSVILKKYNKENTVDKLLELIK